MGNVRPRGLWARWDLVPALRPSAGIPTGIDPQWRRVALGRRSINRDGPRGGMACVCSHPVRQVRATVSLVGSWSRSAHALWGPRDFRCRCHGQTGSSPSGSVHPPAEGRISGERVFESKSVGELGEAWGGLGGGKRNETTDGRGFRSSRMWCRCPQRLARSCGTAALGCVLSATPPVAQTLLSKSSSHLNELA
jgi:hypothetical protein